jgi:hypothetical protein
LIGVVRLEQALKGFFRKCQPELLSEPSATLVPLLSVNTFEPSATASGFDKLHRLWYDSRRFWATRRPLCILEYYFFARELDRLSRD